MDDAILGKNLMIYPRVYIGYRAEVQTGTALNTGVHLDHHNVIRACIKALRGQNSPKNISLLRNKKISEIIEKRG